MILFIIYFYSSFLNASEFQVKTKDYLKRHLEEKILSVDEWIVKKNQSDFDLLCLGERHDSFHRNFIAEQITSKLYFHLLAVEEKAKNFDVLLQTHLSHPLGQGFAITGAPFLPLLQSALVSPHPFLFQGVEYNKKQRAEITFAELKYLQGELSDELPSRDGFIAENIDVALKKGIDRIVALYGSKHCSRLSNGFGFSVPFARFLADKYKEKKKIETVYIVNKQKAGYLWLQLKSMGLMSTRPIVLENLSSLNPEMYNYNAEILLMALSYDSIIFIP